MKRTSRTTPVPGERIAAAMMFVNEWRENWSWNVRRWWPVCAGIVEMRAGRLYREYEDGTR